MKKYIFLFPLLFSAAAAAQSDMDPLAKSRKWHLNAASLSLGVTADTYNNLDMAYMRSFARNNQLTKIDLSEYNQVVYASVAGANVGLDISFKTGTDRDLHLNKWQREWQIGMDIQFDREAMIDYETKSDPPSFTSVTYCILNNVIDLRAAYLLKLNTYHRFSPHIGIGGSVGKTFNNRFLFLNSTDQNFDGELGNYFGDDTIIYTGMTSFFYHVTVPLGIDYNFGNNMALGLNSQIGLGVEKIKGGDTYFIPNNFQIGLSVKRYFNFHQGRWSM
ncbi:hypothetical protein QQ020_07310 [Fulvivirgaceae bacterium BMA12]|uniref:Outer membrane protein beta-barrel domain-containing protein n=1 Tax=Agaribacillus aureus TaxID=3051825 RepID=A0ABT8L273_9BACT|nr:hypothetical protein [Fulvivirgaceae bacterium BMA12]